MSETIIKAENVIKDFYVGKKPIRILKGINIEIFRGEFVMIYGPSGCGKSTFLNIIDGWEKPSEGKVTVNNEDLFLKTDDEKARLRQGGIALINQSSSWVKSLNVIDNIALPYLFSGANKSIAHQRAMKLLQILKLDKYAKYKPMDLSGGQQQRISLIRSLISNPKIIMADEPTGNLDSKSSKLIMELFNTINKEFGRTIILVTHNLDLLSYADKKINIIDGEVAKIEDNGTFKNKQFDKNLDVIDINLPQELYSGFEEEEKDEVKIG